MSLIRSLTSGTSSLKAHQQRLDVISNNIANTNTIGYKSSRTTFADQFSQTYGWGVRRTISQVVELVELTRFKSDLA
ncbi:MAG: hypothetical protein IPM69_10790 [Ignavibacteria bacterium]|nr:hypothetical protein [Ignavibacteria bacterium]